MGDGVFIYRDRNTNHGATHKKHKTGVNPYRHGRRDARVDTLSNVCPGNRHLIALARDRRFQLVSGARLFGHISR